MAAYATVAEFEVYVGSPTTDAVALELELVAAERDVDWVIGPLPLESNGLKFGLPKTTNEKALTPGQVIALSRATCAQAEYRLEMGPSFFVRDQHDFVAGPDFSRRGALSYIGPKALHELENGGLGASRGAGLVSCLVTSDYVVIP